MIEIDHRHLHPDTLENLLTEIALREGTDYGEMEIAVDDKKRQLRDGLDLGKAVIVYYPSEGFCDLIQKAEK
jgi:uncharacterized protein